jgi:hypothetical protein
MHIIMELISPDIHYQDRIITLSPYAHYNETIVKQLKQTLK